MGAFSNYLEEKIVEHFLRNNAITPPTTVYVALFESDPGEATGGTETASAERAVAFAKAFYES